MYYNNPMCINSPFFINSTIKRDRSERTAPSRGGTLIVESPMVLVSDILGSGAEQATGWEKQ
jgi:hypothetical protein